MDLFVRWISEAHPPVTRPVGRMRLAYPPYGSRKPLKQAPLGQYPILAKSRGQANTTPSALTKSQRPPIVACPTQRSSQSACKFGIVWPLGEPGLCHLWIRITN